MYLIISETNLLLLQVADIEALPHLSGSTSTASGCLHHHWECCFVCIAVESCAGQVESARELIPPGATSTNLKNKHLNFASLRWENSGECSPFLPRIPQWDGAPVTHRRNCFITYILLASFPFQSHFSSSSQCFLGSSPELTAWTWIFISGSSSGLGNPTQTIWAFSSLI